MNIQLLERAAVALGELVDDVVFVGGATIELWLTDPGAIDIRPTLDVDVVVEVTSRLAFHDFEAETGAPSCFDVGEGIRRSRELCRIPPEQQCLGAVVAPLLVVARIRDFLRH